MKKMLKKVNKYILLIFVLSVLLFITMFFNGYKYGHDTVFHLSNLIAWIKNLDTGSIIPSKILLIIGNDFGYGTGIFYPPLSHYLPLLIYKIVNVFGFGIILSIKLSYLITMFLSELFMYFLVNKISKSDLSGFVFLKVITDYFHVYFSIYYSFN